jgi:hypothetical protein
MAFGRLHNLISLPCIEVRHNYHVRFSPKTAFMAHGEERGRAFMGRVSWEVTLSSPVWDEESRAHGGNHPNFCFCRCSFLTAFFIDRSRIKMMSMLLPNTVKGKDLAYSIQKLSCVTHHAERAPSDPIPNGFLLIGDSDFGVGRCVRDGDGGGGGGAGAV